MNLGATDTGNPSFLWSIYFRSVTPGMGGVGHKRQDGPCSNCIYDTSTKGTGLISWNCFLHLAFLELFPSHCRCYCFSFLFILFTACKQWIQYLFYYPSVNIIQYVFSDSSVLKGFKYKLSVSFIPNSVSILLPYF